MEGCVFLFFGNGEALSLSGADFSVFVVFHFHTLARKKKDHTVTPSEESLTNSKDSLIHTISSEFSQP